MRLATTASVALIALSTAALAQVADPAAPQSQNNIMVANTLDDAAAPTGTADNMLDNSASPPPTEPK